MPKRSMSRLACVGCVALACAAALVCVCAILLARRSQCGGGGEDGFTRFAVAADSYICSSLARDILLDGGSAVDAAITALLCTSLINPQSAGIGGGSIFTIMSKNGDVSVINSRETVPKHFKPNLLEKCLRPNSLGPIGPDWIGVPGELRGYEYAHKHFGKLSWDRLFLPVIKLARDGVPVSEYLGRILADKRIIALVQNTSLCEVFCHQNKTLLSVGETLRFPKLARTLEVIAKDGADAFYKGTIGQDLIQDVKAAGGPLSLEDLKSFQVRVGDALSVPLGDFTMHFPPPPSGGALLSFILSVMQGFKHSPLSATDDKKTLNLHKYIETLKFANGQRKYIRDPLHTKLNWHHLMDSGFVDRIRAMISSNGTKPPSYYNVTPSADGIGTTHLSVLASDGSAVSVTSTINYFFGSAFYSPSTGIILNNELVDFCRRVDSVSAGEQPPSSMSPFIVSSKNREKVLVIGASGGGQIITGLATAIMNKLWFGMNLEDSIKDKVVYVNATNAVLFESGFNTSLKEAMRSLGHDVHDNRMSLNVVNAVMKDGGLIYAYSDNRKSGKAAGC